MFRVKWTASPLCQRSVDGLGMVDKPREQAAQTQEASAGGRRWAGEDAVAFAAQARRYELHPHPLEDILVDPRVAIDP